IRSQVREWAEKQARDVEALRRRPHEALRLAKAVADGSHSVIGVAATALGPLSLGPLGGGSWWSSGGGEGTDAHWKKDGLDALVERLDDLVHAWDSHKLQISLAELEKLPKEGTIFRVLDRVQSPDLLPLEIRYHVLPLAKRYSMDPDAVLLDYMHMCCDAIASRRGDPHAIGGPGVTNMGIGGVGGGGYSGGGGGSGGVGAAGMDGGRTTEQRAEAVARCMSAGAGGCSELRSRAVLALARAASFPYSDGLWALVQEALGWGGPMEEELQEAARVLSLAQIVQRHHVKGFSLMDPTRATRLLRHVLAQVHCPTALDDALRVAGAYSHLSERRVYVEFIENIAGSRPRDGVSSELGIAARRPRDGGGGGGVGSRGGGGGGDGDKVDGSLAAALEAHRARVLSVLRRLPSGEGRPVAQEALLYCMRALEDFEMGAQDAGLPPGQLQGCCSPLLCPGEEGKRPNPPAPGSDAEEAMFTAAAAGVLVAFLREMRRQGGARDAGRVEMWVCYLDLSVLSTDLRRIQALQVEFGVFPSGVTLASSSSSRQWSADCGGGTEGDACWVILRGHLAGLECYMSRAEKAGMSGRLYCGVRMTGVGAQKGKKSGGAAAGTGNRTFVGALEGNLPDMWQRIRRLSELLGVTWARVVGHVAKEAARKGRVHEAVDRCHGLLRDRTSLDRKSAAIALRDTAVALSM
ncbi:unnamed protein product, partial [Discosporangium mesarthrocarpum]